MSYDYNELVNTIATARRAAETATDASERLPLLQKAMETCETLSGHCPMTPLLWMQYGETSEEFMLAASEEGEREQARLVRLQVLELALQEFPGSALLQLHYVQQNLWFEQEFGFTGKTMEAVDVALEAVGRGSHANEGPSWIVALYRIKAELCCRPKVDDKALSQSFLSRASVPLKEGNDGLSSEWNTFAKEHNVHSPEQVAQALDKARLRVAKVFGRYSSIEDDIDAIMAREGILARHAVQELAGGALDTPEDWKAILRSREQTYCMGLGGSETAKAFIKYALTLSNSGRRGRDDDEDEDDEEAQLVKSMRQSLPSLVTAVYERGIAECPTVEQLWMSYIRHLTERLSNETPPSIEAPRLQSVLQRAVRNCPYSIALVQEQLKSVLVLADHNCVVVDPDQLLDTVQKALDTKFFVTPTACMELHMTAVCVVKRRILALLSSCEKRAKPLAYDDEEDTKKAKGAKPTQIEEDSDKLELVLQESQDLLEDLGDMYDKVDERLRKLHSSWSEGRSMVWQERALTDSYLIQPLLAVENGGQRVQQDDTLGFWEKAIRIHNPPHPHVYLNYIQHFKSTIPAMTMPQVVSRLRKIRFLFHKAVEAVGRPKSSNASVPDDIEADFARLAQDWVEFEKVVGSDRSQGRAAKAIDKKRQRLALRKPPSSQAAVKRPHEASKETEPEEKPRKKQKVAKEKPEREQHENDGPLEPPLDASERKAPVVTTTNTKGSNDAPHHGETKPARASHKVKVGNLEYPAHAFTVRVSNLSPDVQDMDLVDCFRAKCGAIVHAKIIRDKHTGQSKGWGLVQFEECDSVEKALALDDVIGLHEKLVKVERSHMPAVTLVPPGMHRVNPKGEGKVSKRNQKRREQKDQVGEGSHSTPMDGNEEKKAAPPEPKASVLAFRPRVVARASHQKPKLALDP